MWILGQERQEHWFSFVAHLLGDFWRFLEQACFGDSRSQRHHRCPSADQVSLPLTHLDPGQQGFAGRHSCNEEGL